MLYHINQSILPSTFCDEVIKEGEEKNISKAKIQEGNNANRSSDVSWLDKDKIGIIFNKLDKILKYVEEENELDIKLKQVQKTLNKYGKYIEEIEKDIAILKKTKDKINKLKEIF